MTTRRYAVVQVGDEWKIVGDNQIGRFPTCASAAFATARLMVAAAKDGCDVQLLVQERFGQLKDVTPSVSSYADASWPDRPTTVMVHPDIAAAIAAYKDVGEA